MTTAHGDSSSKMSTPAQLQDLVGEIVRNFPSAQIEWDPFPSGVCVLYVTLNGRDFELEYDPKRGTGISENKEDTSPFIGHDEAFDSIEAAVRRFKALLADAVRTETAPAMALHDKKL